jgi:hypothetical protein
LYSLRFSVYTLWGSLNSHATHFFKETGNIFYPIFVLLSGSILSGGSLAWLFSTSFIESILEVLSKVLILPTSISIMFFYMHTQIKQNYYNLKYFNISIWAINPILIQVW